MLCFCQNEMNSIEINKEIFIQCPKCGLLMKKNIPNAKDEKERYDYHIIDSSYLEYMKENYEIIKPYLKDGITLDFGCGKSNTLEKIMLQDGKICNSYDLYYYPNIPRELYDNIVMIEVFEHLKNLKEDIQMLLKLLKKGGRLIILTQAYDNQTLDWWYLRDITHVTFIRKDTFLYWDWNLKLIYQYRNIFVLERI
ncbi:MAG: class I SAM-dependent methyltransferase [Anaeroplasmataceae bacterium]|nr:class I SAM-dependent methyltransferase [Anaeroplasmataceae bacterium]